MLPKSAAATAEQVLAAKVIRSYERTNDKFDPWLTNGHVQTIMGAYLKDICSYVPKWTAIFFFVKCLFKLMMGHEASSIWTNRESLDTPDGDVFHVDFVMTQNFTGASADEAPWVILCHGLESNAASTTSMDLASGYLKNGMNVACLNYRTCDGTHNKKLGCYHFGFTSDLQQYIDYLRNDKKYKGPIYLSGFSLGANLVLYYLGKLGKDAIRQNIHGGAVLCAPLNQEINQHTLNAKGFNRNVYVANLLSTLKARAEWQYKEFCEGKPNAPQFDYPAAMKATTLMEFDDAYTAPVYGFKDCWDYYRQTSSIHHLDNIHVPTMIVNAKNDVFFEPTLWPTKKSCEHGGPAPLKMIQESVGGHLGFMFHRVPQSDQRLKSPGPSWVATELSDFIKHVHASTGTTTGGK